MLQVVEIKLFIILIPLTVKKNTRLKSEANHQVLSTLLAS